MVVELGDMMTAPRRGIWHLLLYQAGTNDMCVLAISHDNALRTSANRSGPSDLTWLSHSTGDSRSEL